MDQEFLKPSDVARHLNLSQRTVYNLLRRGVLPHYRVGQAVRIRRDDYVAYVEKARHVGPSVPA